MVSHLIQRSPVDAVAALVGSLPVTFARPRAGVAGFDHCAHQVEPFDQVIEMCSADLVVGEKEGGIRLCDRCP